MGRLISEKYTVWKAEYERHFFNSMQAKIEREEIGMKHTEISNIVRKCEVSTL